MNADAMLTGSIYLNAENNPNAVFVIQINVALSTSSFSNVILLNGAQAKNVFWKIEGAVNINKYSKFTGTIICHNGALCAFNTGVTLDGRVFTTSGALTSNALKTTLISTCTESVIVPVNGRKIAISIYPNPFTTSINIIINEVSEITDCQMSIYNILGEQVSNTMITLSTTIIKTDNLHTGIYFYKVTGNSKTLQTGKLISINQIASIEKLNKSLSWIGLLTAIK